MTGRKKKKTATGIIAAVFILLLVYAAAEFTGIIRGSADREIAIEKGEYFELIANKLYENRVIGNKFFFRVYAKIFHGNDLNKIKTGIVKFSGVNSYPTVMNTLLYGSFSANALKITIPEGYNIKEIKTLLLQNGLVSEEKFDDAVANHDFGYSWEKDFPEGSNRLEGFLFPDTYYFSADETETEIIDKMLKRFSEKTAPYMSKIKKTDLTLYETITLASIIEKEGLTDDDFKLISSVFHNRLKRKDHLRFLQSCATVQYLLKEHKSVLSKSDTRISSPYNTYMNPGLPIGPIASPGEKAIEAAIEPADTDYLYFQNDKNGKLHFSVEYDEHLDKIKELQ